MHVCKLLNLNHTFVIDIINSVSTEFKNKCIELESNTETELIITCLNNYHIYSIISQLNLVIFDGPLYDAKNIN